jgi:hypothetical protein
MNGQNGKGDDTRPRQVSWQQWSDNWDLAFGKKDGEENGNKPKKAKSVRSSRKSVS